MPVDAVAARAIALDFVQATAEHVPFGGAFTSEDALDGFMFGNSSRKFSGYRLPWREDLGRPLIYLDEPVSVAMQISDDARLAYDAWAVQDIFDMWKKIRIVAGRLQNNYQAAAMLVVALRGDPVVVMRGLRPYLQPYIDGTGVQFPNDGVVPVLARRMRVYGFQQYSGGFQPEGNRVYQQNANALLFFRAAIPLEVAYTTDWLVQWG